MQAITLQSLILAGPVSFTILFIVMRLLFRGSVLYKIGVATGSVMISNALISGTAARLGSVHYAWAFPLQVVLAVLAFVYVARVVKRPLQQITGGIDELSTGNLSVKMDTELTQRNDEFGRLAVATGQLTQQLNEVVAQISDSASQLSSAGEQLSSSSNELSSGANEQASSVEEISASMEEMTKDMLKVIGEKHAKGLI